MKKILSKENLIELLKDKNSKRKLIAAFAIIGVALIFLSEIGTQKNGSDNSRFAEASCINYSEYVEDLNLVLGLMKSLLNLADLRGMKTVYGSNPAMFDLYKMLRFKKSAGEAKKMYELSLEGYFTCENEEQ